jgi:colanic acid/amylovoran biosynthesis protein
MKAIISNTVVLNSGDAAILMAIFQLLRSAFGSAIEFTIYGSHPDLAAKYYPNLRFRELLYTALRRPERGRASRLRNEWDLRRYLAAARKWNTGSRTLAAGLAAGLDTSGLTDYGSADLICSGGGTYLVEHYDLRPRIFDFEVALALGRPLVLFTQSLGPFKNPAYRKKLASIFEHATLILLRDRLSEQHIRSLGVRNPRIAVTADAAFALADRTVLTVAGRQTAVAAPPRVAISVREWKAFRGHRPTEAQQRYVNAIRDLTIHAVTRYGAAVTFLSTCQGIPEYRDDSELAGEIAESLPPGIARSVDVDRDFHTPDELRVVIREFDLVVSTRMHLAILALGTGTPVIPIAYEFKTRELFENLHHAYLVHDMEAVCPAELIATFDEAMTHLPELRASLSRAVIPQVEQALATKVLLQEVLKPPTAPKEFAGSGS